MRIFIKALILLIFPLVLLGGLCDDPLPKTLTVRDRCEQLLMPTACREFHHRLRQEPWRRELFQKNVDSCVQYFENNTEYAGFTAEEKSTLDSYTKCYLLRRVENGDCATTGLGKDRLARQEKCIADNVSHLNKQLRDDIYHFILKFDEFVDKKQMTVSGVESAEEPQTLKVTLCYVGKFNEQFQEQCEYTVGSDRVDCGCIMNKEPIEKPDQVCHSNAQILTRHSFSVLTEPNASGIANFSDLENAMTSNFGGLEETLSEDRLPACLKEQPKWQRKVDTSQI